MGTDRTASSTPRPDQRPDTTATPPRHRHDRTLNDRLSLLGWLSRAAGRRRAPPAPLYLVSSNSPVDTVRAPRTNVHRRFPYAGPGAQTPPPAMTGVRRPRPCEPDQRISVNRLSASKSKKSRIRTGQPFTMSPSRSGSSQGNFAMVSCPCVPRRVDSAAGPCNHNGTVHRRDNRRCTGNLSCTYQLPRRRTCLFSPPPTPPLAQPPPCGRHLARLRTARVSNLELRRHLSRLFSRFKPSIHSTQARSRRRHGKLCSFSGTICVSLPPK